MFFPLEKPDYQVGQGSSNDFIHYLENPLREDGCEHQLRWNNAPKRDAGKDYRVQPFTNQR